MSTITREQLRERAREKVKSLEFIVTQTAFADTRAELEEELELARIALASLELERGMIRRFDLDMSDCDSCGQDCGADMVEDLDGEYVLWDEVLPHLYRYDEYTIPPAPESVPDELLSAMEEVLRISDRDHEAWHKAKAGIVSCRAAMLKGAEPVTTACKLPMQPLVIDAHGTLRFKENPIVRTLLDYATEHGYGLNEIAREEFDAEDQMHLAQLIGYSLSGYGTLSYVTDESYERAAAAAPQQEVK